MRAPVTAAFLVLYRTTVTAIVRMRAQIAPLAHWMFGTMPEFGLTQFPGTRALGPRVLRMIAMMRPFMSEENAEPAPIQPEGLRIAERRRVNARHLAWAIMVALPLIMLSYFWASLHIGCRFGMAAKSPADLLAISSDAATRMATGLNDPSGPNWRGTISIGIGAATTPALVSLKLWLPMFPLHPPAFPLASSWTIVALLPAITIAWAVKAMLRRGEAEYSIARTERLMRWRQCPEAKVRGVSRRSSPGNSYSLGGTRVMCRSGIEEVRIAGLRHLLPDRWWETAAGLYLCTFKPNRGYAHLLSLDPGKAAAEVADIAAQGFQVIEIFAPAEGRFGYAGLDMTDPYTIDRELGTIEDFRCFVRLAHGNGIAVVVFLNVGYFSLEAPAWLEACADRKAGKNTEKVRWFCWADSPDAPPPTRTDDRSFAAGVVPPDIPDAPKTWGWQYSEAADCYYWARWQAKDAQGNWVGLPSPGPSGLFRWQRGRPSSVRYSSPTSACSPWSSASGSGTSG
jgi:hypothetical protein